MKKTLRQKLTDWERGVFGDLVTTEVSTKGAMGLMAVTCIGLTGCLTGAGYTMGQHHDPRVRAIGNMVYHEGAHQERIEEAREGRSQVNVYQGEHQQKQDFYTYSKIIFNRDSGKKEIEINGWHWNNYVIDHIKNNNFPKEGYTIMQMENGYYVRS